MMYVSLTFTKVFSTRTCVITIFSDLCSTFIPGLIWGRIAIAYDARDSVVSFNERFAKLHVLAPSVSINIGSRVDRYT
jgi:hypothetical protein